MSDNMVFMKRQFMRYMFGIKVGPGLDIIRHTSFLSAILQALFACEEFRVKMILIGHNHPDHQLQRSIGHLFKHMVIGKETFLIPHGIVDFEDLNNDQNATLSLENLLRTIRFGYQDFLKNNPQIPEPLPCVTQVFYVEYAAKCANSNCGQPRAERTSIPGQEYNTLLDFTGTNKTMNIQHAINNLKFTRLENNFTEFCVHCNHFVMEYNRIHPNGMIISIWPEVNEFGIEDVVNVQNQQYSLFACICHDSEQQIYYCYAKRDYYANDDMWHCFKGKIVYEVTTLTQLIDVSLLFYKKVQPIDYYQYINKANSVTPRLVIPPDIEKFSLDSIELNPRVPPLMYNESEPIPKVLGLERHALDNVQGICFMNATLQALYHCQVFRKYILECYEGFGDYHMYLKHLFSAMKYGYNVDDWHGKIYSLIKNSTYPGLIYENGNDTQTFLDALIQCMLLETKQFRIEKGLKTYTDSDRYDTRIKNYANVLIGRDDMSSNEEWRKAVVYNGNSDLYNMFMIQKMTSERCSIGHKNYLKYQQLLMQSIHADIYSLNPANKDTNIYASLQAIIDDCKSPYPRDNKTQCQHNVCSNGMNQLYYYDDGNISRASDILVFVLSNDHTDKNNTITPIKPYLIINEYLVVCGQIYQCMAYTTLLEPNKKNSTNHFVCYARADDNKWWIFDDIEVYGTKDGLMLQQKHMSKKQSIILVFYERINSKIGNNHTVNDHIVFNWPKPMPNTSNASKVVLSNLKQYYGTISYMNAMLQCLYHCYPFRNYIIFDQQINNNPQQTHSLLKTLFVKISQTVTALIQIDTTDFWNAFTQKHRINDENIVNTTQEYDPIMFLLFIINDLLRECNDVFKVLIFDMFRVTYDETTYCITCLHNTGFNTTKYFLLFECTKNSDPKPSVQSMVTVNLAMDLSRKNPVFCNYCLLESEAFIHRTISELPNILILVMNIFKFDRNIRTFNRLERITGINEKIIVNEECFYFRACICCKKFTQQSSHYKAYVKCDDGLYCFDDFKIKPVSVKPNGILNLKNVYVMFYEKY